MERRGFLAALAALCACAPAGAATLDVIVRDAAGRPVANAVVQVHVAGLAPPLRPSQTLRVEQKDISFQPFVLVVPQGSAVSFPNRDKVRHHVYSFSKAKRFELKLYGRDETRAVTFDKPGAVPLGCNIHDAMSGFVMVVDTPWAAKTNADGRVTLTDLPAGPARLRVWHPYARVRGNEIARPVSVGSGAQMVALDVRYPMATR